MFFEFKLLWVFGEKEGIKGISLFTFESDDYYYPLFDITYDPYNEVFYGTKNLKVKGLWRRYSKGED